MPGMPVPRFTLATAGPWRLLIGLSVLPRRDGGGMRVVIGDGCGLRMAEVYRTWGAAIATTCLGGAGIMTGLGASILTTGCLGGSGSLMSGTLILGGSILATQEVAWSWAG